MRIQFFLAFLLLLNSCTYVSEKENKAFTSRLLLQEKLENTTGDRLLSEIATRNNVTCLWDTVNLPYTIQYSKILVCGNQLIDDFKLLDIYQSDGFCKFYICVNYHYFGKRRFHFIISGDELNYKTLLSKENPVLLVKIKEIKKITWRLVVEDGISFDLFAPFFMFYPSSEFIGRGDLIGIFDFATRTRAIKVGFDEFEEDIWND